ncbi:DNA repair protein [Roseivivax halodurans JCM 10272]|uniref:DNA repair protein n=1 Tax=Roseivivax halodurans JCM 10272 TaxID=1449350 RepID=X7EKL6_9RHOB|nr:DNA repair protein [Roseivivax halodurans]ETX16437.1 DNA repair protein [Roseivivax halodurans JCM 10272]
MVDTMRSGYVVFQYLMQRTALIALSGLALALLAYTVACAAGHAEWLSLPLTFGDATFEGAGWILQSGVTALAVGLCFFLPANARIMALETSHRRFHIGMQDVARAYQVAHAADRQGVFTLKSEFDSIRERMAHLREHPDLSDLEPSVLEIASQMSHLSRDLAQVYSDRNVARARDFLIQRQQEVEDFNCRLDHAKTVATDMRRWLDRVETDEAVAESQLARLCDELTGILPELHETEQAPTHEPAAEDTPVDELAAWREAAPHQDDARIVSILGQRAAE